jgi:hypothetical protein
MEGLTLLAVVALVILVAIFALVRLRRAGSEGQTATALREAPPERFGLHRAFGDCQRALIGYAAAASMLRRPD